MPASLFIANQQEHHFSQHRLLVAHFFCVTLLPAGKRQRRRRLQRPLKRLPRLGKVVDHTITRKNKFDFFLFVLFEDNMALI
jgi:hypothetical protein